MTNKPNRKGFWLLLAGLIMLAVLALLVLMVKLNANKQLTNTKSETSVSETIETRELIQDSEYSIQDLPYSPDKFITGVENLPRSLQGTEVDGEIIINDKAQLVATRGLRRLYDYFLSALGEEDSETIDARVEAYILNTTPQPAANEAINLYYQYQTYLKQVNAIQIQFNKPTNFNEALKKVEQGELNIEDIEKQQQQVRALRSQLFNPKVEAAFFRTEDQLQAYNKQMLKIAQDKSLSNAEKQQAKQRYLQNLPDSLTKKQAEQQANLQQLMSRTEQMKKRGADEQQLLEMRTELVGIEAAHRLAELDKQTQDFDRRFESYQQQKQQIIASNASPSKKQQQIVALEQKLFSDNEQKRLIGYEQFKNQSQ
ncbi:lipase secretion chaperone [Psychrobacter phenylpyruvicus]|uniref:Lipase chaperone n=1 Tax=Psychrobacter phenylpyruvicus TaxID=29432 RepID=A0A379LK92_9GAMM|nr:lipase secretion chaperone [Psychrobacter phenylpyruvicus]SUD91040.1 Lipase modulator [Psychrobacter phenylpyruvicus]